MHCCVSCMDGWFREEGGWNALLESMGGRVGGYSPLAQAARLSGGQPVFGEWVRLLHTSSERGRRRWVGGSIWVGGWVNESIYRERKVAYPTHQPTHPPYLIIITQHKARAQLLPSHLK